MFKFLRLVSPQNKKFDCLSINKDQFRFICTHQTLREFSYDLLNSMSDLEWRHATVFYVGAHRDFSDFWDTNELKIVIQTEQYCDVHGRFLWSAGKTSEVSNIWKAAHECDYFWDLSVSNIQFYKKIGLYEIIEPKFISGPYVFSEKPRLIQPATSSNVVFYGALNERRRRLIKQHNEMPIKVLKKTYGDKLTAKILQSAAVLNLHFDEGVYSEIPRILSAFNRGKVLVSEELAYPFLHNKHYVGLESWQRRDYGLVFEALADLVTSRYSVSELFKQI